MAQVSGQSCGHAPRTRVLVIGSSRKNVEKPILYTIPAPAVATLAFHMMEGLQ
jgi:hypothetical protein